MAETKVLLVDDEEAYVTTLAERLELRGFLAKVALSGEEAMRIAAADPPHVMVVDLRLPDVGGLSVMERVKSLHPTVQVIVLTGHGAAAEEDEARRLGACGWLTKPADITDVCAAIRVGLRRTNDAPNEVDGSHPGGLSAVGVHRARP